MFNTTPRVLMHTIAHHDMYAKTRNLKGRYTSPVAQIDTLIRMFDKITLPQTTGPKMRYFYDDNGDIAGFSFCIDCDEPFHPDFDEQQSCQRCTDSWLIRTGRDL